MSDRFRDRELIDRIDRLRSRRERERTGVFYAEGIRFVAEALTAGAEIETVVYSRQLLIPSGLRVLKRCAAARIPTGELSASDFLRNSTALEAQGIGALIRQRWTKLREAVSGKSDCWLALQSVHSPGNLGTILRTAEAAGARGAILLGGQVDPFEPAAVRATMGSLFHQELIRSGIAELREWKSRHDVRVIGAAPDGSVDYRRADYGGQVALMMGLERKGLSLEQIALCDQLVRIPMVGRCDSLNVGVAASLMLYEVFRQRNPLTPSSVANGRGFG